MKGDLISHCHIDQGDSRMSGGVSCTFEIEGQTEVDIKMIIEEAENNYSAYSPDYPGCVATGDTIEATKINMLKALVAHIEAGE